jgi:hypothetical protein
MIGRRGFIGSTLALLVSPALGFKLKPEFKINSSKTITGVFLTNPNDAFVPEEWARESLKILEENMVIGYIVHKDRSTL